VILSVSSPGLPALVPACALLFIGAAGWLARRRSRARRRARPVPTPSDVVLVLHASQTGTARALAQEAGEALRQAGRAVRVDGLGAIRSLDALTHRHVLLALSTTGDGEPPEDARPFVEAMLGWNGPGGRPLAGVSFGLLALGDRRYPDFCGFGQRVESWLRRRGASALFETIEVDGGSPADLARWHAALAAFVGVAPPPAWGDVAVAASRPWRLAWRGVLNPGSVGEPMVHLALEPADGAPAPDWQAGDIARVSVPTERWARDYSVASVPADGRLELVLRRIRRRNGRPGAASGWLSEAPPGSELALRLLPHPSFRLGDNADRPLILVGTGAGIAGLRGLLRARAGRPGARHWLLFGERQRAHDFLFRAEIEAWQAQGVLERVDLAFSRDEPAGRYVQHVLRDEAGAVRRWVAEGAAIYVCGARVGMAEEVHDALADVLGGPAFGALAAAGRYRRDVY